MKRRTFLGTLSIGVVSTAGCSAIRPESTTASEDEGDSDRSLRMSADPTAKFDTPTEIGYADHEIEQFSRVTVEVGDSEETETASRIRPHEILLLNAAPARRIVEFQLVDEHGEEIVLHDIHELEADTALRVRITDPSEYVFNVYVPETDSGGTVRITEFDCNRRGKLVRAPANGGLQLASDETLMDCN